MESKIGSKRAGRPPKPVRAPGQRGRLPGEKPKKKGINFRRHIFTVLAYQAPGMTIKKSTMDALNTITVDMLKRIGREAAELCEHGKSKVLRADSIEAAVKMIFPGGTRQYAVESGQQAVKTFNEAK